MLSKLRPYFSWIFIGLLMLIAMICLAMANHWQNEKQIWKAKYERTLGRVIQLRTNEKGDFYPVIGFVTLDSQKVFVHAKNEFSAFKEYEVGEILELYYDLINPDDTHIIRNEGFEIVFMNITGILMGLLAIAFATLEIYKKVRTQQLFKNGKRIRAQIKSVAKDPQKKRENKAAFVIYCEWKANPEATAYSFRSEPLLRDPTPMLPADRMLDVIIDPNNPENYYVDIDFLFE
ncbi:MAG: DUF3592 domain-containing protein [Bernardetiaceae bacterium]|nr:DUF3592 domain-containing protein [Bernardetiaceae bacterium]